MSHIAELLGEEFKEEQGLGRRGQGFVRRHVLASAVAVFLISGAGLSAYHAASEQNAPPPAPAAVAVTATRIAPQSVRIWSEFSGRMTAVNSADIRPEVSGRITEIRFKDGQQVKAGDILFVIDPRPLRSGGFAKAKADLATAQTNAHLAQTELDRATNAVGSCRPWRATYYDQRTNADGVAHAAIQSAAAEVTQAQLDVDHAYVKAPIAGRVSRAEITVGNLVQAGANAPLLTSIVSDDGIYADFEVDEQTYLHTVRDHADTAAQEQQIPVRVDAFAWRRTTSITARSKASTTRSTPAPARSAPARASPMPMAR